MDPNATLLSLHLMHVVPEMIDLRFLFVCILGTLTIDKLPFAGVLLHAPAVRFLLDLSHSPRTDLLDVFPSTRTSSPAGEVDPVHQKQT